MAKYYEFQIYEFSKSEFFGGAIREKKDVLEILMHAVKYMIAEYDQRVLVKKHSPRTIGTMTLEINKNSRIYFNSDKIHYSLGFPFTVSEQPQGLEFSYKKIHIIDPKIASNVLAILNDDVFLHGNCMYDFMDCIYDIDDDKNTFWDILLQLFLEEEGYLRFDHDPDNINGYIHPLNHIDVFYRDKNKTKFGLHSSLSPDEARDILNPNSNCYYLVKP